MPCKTCKLDKEPDDFRNKGLGMFRDNPALLVAAANYVLTDGGG